MQVIEDTEYNEKLHVEQEKALKESIREMERSKKRENANIEYLKNVLVKFLLTDEHEALLPVLSTVLQFSPEETTKIREKLSAQKEGYLWGTMNKLWSSPRK